METLLWDETFTVPIRYVFFQISSVKNFWVAAWVRNKRSYSLDMSVKSEKHIFNTWSCVKSVTPSEKHIFNTWSCAKLVTPSEKHILNMWSCVKSVTLSEKHIFNTWSCVKPVTPSEKHILNTWSCVKSVTLSEKHIFNTWSCVTPVTLSAYFALWTCRSYLRKDKNRVDLIFLIKLKYWNK